MKPTPAPDRDATPAEPLPRLGRLIGRSRLIVLSAVVAMLLVSFSLFLIGTVKAVEAVWTAWAALFERSTSLTGLTLAFLEIVVTMLKAVVFYLIGVGLYSLFVAPLNVAVSLGVETLHDLESKVLNVIVVILSVTFLEHFIRWEAAVATLQFGGALALVVAALVLFQIHGHRAKEAQRAASPDMQVRAKLEMFEHDHEKHHIGEAAESSRTPDDEDEAPARGRTGVAPGRRPARARRGTLRGARAGIGPARRRVSA